MKHLVLAAPLMLLCACAGSLKEARTVAAAPDVIRSTARYERAYLLAPGDMVEVLVDRMPELSRTATIRPDGMVTLPKTGDIRLAGLAPMDAARSVRQALLPRVIDPQVTVAVTNPREARVFVAGEVNRPGAVPLRDAPTAAQAIVLAGDLGKAAAHGNVALIRLDDAGHLTAHILHTQAKGHAGLLFTLQNLPLQPDDVIVVQESGAARFGRFIQNYVNAPLGGLTQLIAPYVQLRLLQEINRD
ncbi:polysaccharide biosynthesis/export family protein [Sphingobium cloacae]|uniref:Polysaccharide biosynthesis/export protein n=1 Tax=Sphingobium cloacae TaxID=120107 RepID=A0A1E1F381_9SPHN|nr:polysaccharide biosynthesis/export family protein [Sphingobium cloacae]BAV64965.1 polysaccharide biosynthesis/export protein [Sphingobium cloacae]